jgi:hypothetical protein
VYHGEEDWLVEPVIVDAAGGAVPVTPAVYDGDTWGFVAETPMAPGRYTLVGVAEFPDFALDEPFEILDAGQTEADIRDSLEPGVYSILDTPEVTGDLTDLLSEYMDPYLLEVLEVQEDAFLGRILMASGDSGCVVLQDHFDLTESGDASWSTTRLEVSSSTPPTVFYDAWLHLGFTEGAISAAGVEGGALLETRGIDADRGEAAGSLCDIGAFLGMACQPCPDDGAPFCLDLQGFKGQLTLSDLTFAEALPFCGVDLSDAGSSDIDIDIDFDCSCAHGSGRGGLGAFLLAGLLGLVRRR